MALMAEPMASSMSAVLVYSDFQKEGDKLGATGLIMG